MGDSEPKETEPLESWIVAVGAVVNKFFNGGLRRVGALMFVECMNRYHVNRKQASIPFTVSYTIVFVLGPLVGSLEKFFQLRSLVIASGALSAIGVAANFFAEDVIFLTVFWGFVFGIGGCICTSLIPEILNRHFDKHMSLVNGLFTAGTSIGATVLPLLSDVLIKLYGLSATFLIMGALTLNTVPMSLLMHDYPSTTKGLKLRAGAKENKCTANLNSLSIVNSNGCHSLDHAKNQPINEKITFSTRAFNYEESDNPLKCRNVVVSSVSKTLSNAKDHDSSQDFRSVFSVLISPVFIAISVMVTSYIFPMTTFSIIILDYAAEKGVHPDQNNYILIAFSISDILGRLGLGWIADCGLVSVNNFVIVNFVLLGLICILFTFSDGFVMYLMSSTLIGLILGVLISYSPKIIKDSIVAQERTMAVSSRYFFFTPIAVAMPFILGYFKDVMKSYDELVYIMAAFSFLGGISVFCTPYLATRRKMLLFKPSEIPGA